MPWPVVAEIATVYCWPALATSVETVRVACWPDFTFSGLIVVPRVFVLGAERIASPSNPVTVIVAVSFCPGLTIMIAGSIFISILGATAFEGLIMNGSSLSTGILNSPSCLKMVTFLNVGLPPVSFPLFWSGTRYSSSSACVAGKSKST
ncbi:MAG: hypothetical protein BWX90_00261 [bacterium ADurb.Bin132]|nr:MAG: hypothetical protein BWX90_00261 [bacterium ADurb.Bin132]